MGYITEQDEAERAYQVFRVLEDTLVLPDVLSADGGVLLKNLPAKSVADSLLTLATYEESRKIKEMKQRGKNVFDPNRKMPSVSSEIDLRGNGKLWVGRRAVGMIRDCVANLRTKARAAPTTYKNR